MNIKDVFSEYVYFAIWICVYVCIGVLCLGCIKQETIFVILFL